MTLYRYLIKEQLVPLIVCFMGLSLVLTLGRLLQLTRYLFTSSVTTLDLIEIISYAMPKLILYALPMATLIGTILAFTRLNLDNELIALRAAGVGFRQFLPAVLSVALVATGLSFSNTLYIMPEANKAFQQKLSSLGRASLPALLREGVFIDVIPDIVFFFQKVNPSRLSIEGIFVQDKRQPQVRLAIVAKQAQLSYREDLDQISFHIADGIITRVGDNLKDAQTISFKAYELTLSLQELFQASSKNSKNKGEMSLSDLRRKIDEGGRGANLRYALEYHQRLALPLSCLLLGLAGAPLGALFRQRSAMGGVTLGLGIFLAYYVALSAGKGLGENGLIPPSVSIWTPNSLALLLVGGLWIKMHRETRFHLPWACRRRVSGPKDVLNACRRQGEPKI